MKKTVRQCFDFGFEEMRVISLGGSQYIVHHRKDFEQGRMNKFFDYPIDQFEKEFGVIVSFT